MNLSEDTKRSINAKLLSTIGISYDEFEKLDFDKQQELIRNYHKKNSKSKEYSIEMIGSGEHSIFIKVKKGKKVMINSGTVIETGLMLEEAKQSLNDRYDDTMYSKPIAMVKKLVRRIKK